MKNQIITKVAVKIKMAAIAGAVLFSYANAALAQNFEIRERILKDETNPTTVELNRQTVRCSDLGYSNFQLKVSVPDLKFLAALDHANAGEAQPCVTAGRCQPGNQPEDLLTDPNPFVLTTVQVVLREVLAIDHSAKTCRRTLRENVTTQIRGKTFTHMKTADLGQYPYDICIQL